MCFNMHGTNCIYPPSEREIERYRTHGVAILRLADMYPEPVNGKGKIDLGPLLEIHKPAKAWMRLGPDARLIITANEDGGNAGCPERALKINWESLLPFDFGQRSFRTGLLSPMVETILG